MMSSFFIARPIFAFVLAIMLMAIGGFALQKLPVEQYPDIAPPRISISATYTGASATEVENSITQVLEQQINGIDGLLYFTGTSNANGTSNISLYFEQGTDANQAQMQVQNAISSSLNRLPNDVQTQGVRVRKSLSDSYMVIGLFDETGQANPIDISDYLTNHFQQNIARVAGVGEVNVFGSQYAMRIWLDPYKLHQYNLTITDIRNAIESQNSQVAAGALGDLPMPQDQYLNVKVTSGSLLRTPQDFDQIILKGSPQGGFVYLKDVARVEIGAENYQSFNLLNGYPAAGLSISLANNANLMETSRAIYQTVHELEKHLPPGYKVAYPRDGTPFVEASIHEVIKTLLEAIGLVVLVMLLFLHNWRATIIPAITVPVVILGTFAIIWLLGLSINTLTLFALVLAIGLLVDDAIVVVENVERLMHEQVLSAREASLLSMREISGALVGITLVLTAVFVPMAFFGGSTGVIYRQFSLTLVAAMGLSLLVALILTPALCAVLLKPKSADQPARWIRVFDKMIEVLKHFYTQAIQRIVAWRWIAIGLFVTLSCLFAVLYLRIPSSFLPQEDQGMLSIQFTLPAGTPIRETERVAKSISQYFQTKEQHNVNSLMMIIGRNSAGTGQNLGQGYLSLKSWQQRSAKKDSAKAIRSRAMKYFARNNQAKINVSMPPAIRGLGSSDKIEFYVQNVGGLERAAFLSTIKTLQQESENMRLIEPLDRTSNPDLSILNVKIDPKATLALGLNLNDVNRTLSTAWSGSYVNDYLDRGTIKRVYIQGDAAYRRDPQDLNAWFVKNTLGEMVSLGQIAQVKWDGSASSLERFMGYPAVQFQAQPTEGTSTGTAMQAISQLVAKIPDLQVAWSGLAFQEQRAGHQAGLLYAASILFMFLCLAALFESIRIPLVVMTAIPLGVGGAIVLSYTLGLSNDVYFQIALLTTIGLSCKNAVLMVEFAYELQRQGRDCLVAAQEAARLRLRPILMTSIAFGAGVIPLMLASGAGALSRQSIGFSVFGGVVFGTILVLLYIPLFFYLIARKHVKAVSSS